MAGFLYIYPVSQNFVQKIQNFDLQDEPLRFNIKFFHTFVCNFTQKKFNVYLHTIHGADWF